MKFKLIGLLFIVSTFTPFDVEARRFFYSKLSIDLIVNTPIEAYSVLKEDVPEMALVVSDDLEFCQLYELPLSKDTIVGNCEVEPRFGSIDRLGGSSDREIRSFRVNLDFVELARRFATKNVSRFSLPSEEQYFNWPVKPLFVDNQFYYFPDMASALSMSFFTYSIPNGIVQMHSDSVAESLHLRLSFSKATWVD